MVYYDEVSRVKAVALAVWASAARQNNLRAAPARSNKYKHPIAVCLRFPPLSSRALWRKTEAER